MCLVFLAFLIMTCVFSYPKGARQCMVHSLAGRVLWYYATITLSLLALSCVSICTVAYCVGCFTASKVDSPRLNSEGGKESDNEVEERI